MQKTVFDFKSPDFQKLVAYGFKENGKIYSYITQISEGQFELRVEISSAGEVKTELTDLATGEPYTLHLIADAAGTFVGAVRAEYERVLTDISENCFVNDVFKGNCAHAVIDYVREKYGGELEFLWDKLPTAAIWRRKDSKKWYGILMALSKRKLGLDSDGETTVIDLRIDPEVLPKIVDGKNYFAGYHMNKKSWFTMCLDGSVPAEEVCEWLDKSYDLAKK